MVFDQLKLSPEEAAAFRAHDLLSVEHALALAERWLEAGMSSLALACLLGETPSTWGELAPDFEKAMVELGVQTPGPAESQKLCLVVVLRAYLDNLQATPLTLDMLRQLLSQSRDGDWARQIPQLSAIEALLLEIDEWPYIYPALSAPSLTYEASLAQLLEELRTAAREILLHLEPTTGTPSPTQPA
tara:strand:- start:827 stop:1387 length:561 start_codon:yes stop_codon:yes gene_type:complete